VHLVLGTGLPALVLGLQVLACRWQQDKGSGPGSWARQLLVVMLQLVGQAARSWRTKRACKAALVARLGVQHLWRWQATAAGISGISMQ
jgi:hypothetical protein